MKHITNQDSLKPKEPPFIDCPDCKRLNEDGKLVWVDKLDRNNKRVQFYGCSNFEKGCRYIYSSREEEALKKYGK